MLGFSALSESPLSTLDEGMSGVLSGVSTLTGGFYFRYQLGANFTGVATIVPVTLTGGNAVWALDGVITGVATLSAIPHLRGFLSGSLSGVATLRAPILAGGNISRGRAYLAGSLNQYRQIVNPVFSGDLIDQTNLSKLRFTVNSSVVSLTSSAQYNLLDMRFNYDGKEASFSEVVTPTIGNPSWSPEQTAQIELDFGSGLKTYFKGKIRSRRHEGQNNNEQILYTAQGYQTLADDVTVLNSDGLPRIEFTVPTTIYFPSTIGTTIPYPISQAVQGLFDLSTTALASQGIPTTIGTPGLETLTANLPQTLQISNTGFFQALSQVVAQQPGVKVYFDDIQQAWTFPNLLDTPTVLCRVESTNILELIYESNVNDRYTAIQLYGEPAADEIATHASTKTGGYIGRSTIDLQPNWNTTIEGDWTVFKGAAGLTPDVLEDDYFWVYRRFKIPNDVISQAPGTPLECMAKVSRWGHERWVRIKGKANFKRRTFTAHYPVINDGDPYLPGDARPSSELKLTYWPLGAFAFTGVNSSGTPTGTSLTVSTSSYVSLRYPQIGFEGTAFDLFNVQRVLTQLVPVTEVTTANAQSALSARKDVIVSGSIPIDGDPVEAAINLNARFRVQHGSQLTGLQSFSAIVTGYRYQFGKRGRNEIEINTDVGQLVRI